MPDSIFLLPPSNQLHELSEAGYLSEDVLQQLLAQHPNLLSGSQISPGRPRRWLLVSREFGVPDAERSGNRWSLDHLFLDQDGVPTLVEVKRSTDTRIRREVIGQILDYAANAVTYWSIEEVTRLYVETCQAQGIDGGEQLAAFLEGAQESGTFWEQVKTNLRAGKIRMLIVADVIPRELQRVIEFLNEQMRTAEILGVEIKQYRNEEMKTLVPRVVGLTTEAQSAKAPGTSSASGQTWTEETYLAALPELAGAEDAGVMRRIIDWHRTRVSYFWFGSGKRGSCCPVLKTDKGNRYCFWFWTSGHIEVSFQYVRHQPPFDQEAMRLELLQRLNAIPGVRIPVERVNVRPSFPVSVLREPASFDKFIAIMDWFWHQVHQHAQ